jgi:hypothetical protein
VNVRRPGLDKAVGQSLHVSYLVPFSFSIFLIVVSKHRCPGNLPLGHDLCKFGQDRFRVPRRALAIQLIAGKNDEVGSLGIENFRKEGRREVVRAVARGDGGVTASALGDREV